jgi:hypothetical protein
VCDATWAALDLSDEQRLDLLLLAGWYHAIAYVARAARVPLEPGAPRFVDSSTPVDGPAVGAQV